LVLLFRSIPPRKAVIFALPGVIAFCCLAATVPDQPVAALQGPKVTSGVLSAELPVPPEAYF
jgi:hypothetical protein